MFIDFAQPISLPPYWLNHPEVVRRYEDNMFEQATALAVPHACPLKMKWASEAAWWQFPIEPVESPLASLINLLISRIGSEFGV